MADVTFSRPIYSRDGLNNCYTVDLISNELTACGFKTETK